MRIPHSESFQGAFTVTEIIFENTFFQHISDQTKMETTLTVRATYELMQLKDQ